MALVYVNICSRQGHRLCRRLLRMVTLRLPQPADAGGLTMYAADAESGIHMVPHVSPKAS